MIWRWTGYNALIYLAAMQAIPADLYESAALDGAVALAAVPPRDDPVAASDDPLHRRRLDHRRDASCSASRCCSAAVSGSTGGSEHQYQTLGLYMYDQGWVNRHLGRASAIAWTMFLILL